MTPVGDGGARRVTQTIDSNELQEMAATGILKKIIQERECDEIEIFFSDGCPPEIWGLHNTGARATTGARRQEENLTPRIVLNCAHSEITENQGMLSFFGRMP